MSLEGIERELAQLDRNVPWMLRRRIRLRLAYQYQLLLDKWFDSQQGKAIWTDDDDYIYMHYHVPAVGWEDWFPE